MELGIPGLERCSEVGRGGSAVVYRAWEAGFGRWVAVKVFALDEDPRRLERERLAIGPLSDHPNIVPVHGGGVTPDSRPYLVMGFMDGGSLLDRVRSRGPFTPEETAAFGVLVAGALQFAHDNGVRHRDIKPQNILYDRFGAPRLADFGIAHVGGDGFRTVTGEISGTIAYMAPEVARGEPYTEAADIFSLGATLYFALAGRHLFTQGSGETSEAFVVRRMGTPQRPEFPAGIPQWLQDVVCRATAADPSARFPSAAVLRDALSGTSGPQDRPIWVVRPDNQDLPPDKSPREEPQDPARTAGGRSPGRVRLVLVGLLVTVVMAATVLFAFNGAPESAQSGTGSPGGGTGAGTRTPQSPSPEVTLARTDPALGAEAIRTAVAALKAKTGVDDPRAVDLTFYPFTWNRGTLTVTPRVIAVLVQPNNPALVDTYEFEDGVVEGPKPTTAPGGGTIDELSFAFSDIDWSAMEAMLRRTESVCRASAERAGIPLEAPTDVGAGPGVSHIGISRSWPGIEGNSVKISVDFTGGQRWSGGYLPFSAKGRLLTTTHCDV